MPKLFFDEYKSKGANVYYEIYYVDSAEPKGTVVEMSRYGEFIPLETWITIGISRGNLQGSTQTPPADDGGDDTDEPISTAGSNATESFWKGAFYLLIVKKTQASRLKSLGR